MKRDNNRAPSPVFGNQASPLDISTINSAGFRRVNASYIEASVNNNDTYKRAA